MMYVMKSFYMEVCLCIYFTCENTFEDMMLCIYHAWEKALKVGHGC